MRRVLVGAMAAAALVAMAGPALADPPEVQQKSCLADGGTFVRDHGVKTCTTTSVDQQTLEGPSVPFSRSEFIGGFAVYDITYTGTSRYTATVRTTTARTQKGNGEVTTEQSSELLSSSVEVLTCHVAGELLGVSFDRDVPADVCANPENYPVDQLPLL
jgi:hypothetical protein